MSAPAELLIRNRSTSGPLRVDARWRSARRILAVRVDNLGDVLMTTPAFAAIKSAAGDRHLTLLATPAGAGIGPHAAMIDELIVHDVPWTRGGSAGRSAESDMRLIEQLRERRFDAAIIFTVCSQSALPAALICRLAGIPLRLAYSRENPYDLLTDWRLDDEVVETGMRHEVVRQLDLVRSVGFGAIEAQLADDHLHFDLHERDRQAARRCMRESGGDSRWPYIVVHPGASAASRRYPADRMGAAARAVADSTGCQIVVVGGASERELVDKAGLAAGSSAVKLAGVLSLGELGALIAGARLMICNNSGPMHISAAVGTPVVALYALTNPQHTPWHVPAAVLNHDVPCRHCLKSTCPQGHHACLQDVTIAQIVEAALRLVSATDREEDRARQCCTSP